MLQTVTHMSGQMQSRRRDGTEVSFELEEIQARRAEQLAAHRHIPTQRCCLACFRGPDGTGGRDWRGRTGIITSHLVSLSKPQSVDFDTIDPGARFPSRTTSALRLAYAATDDTCSASSCTLGIPRGGVRFHGLLHGQLSGGSRRPWSTSTCLSPVRQTIPSSSCTRPVCFNGTAPTDHWTVNNCWSGT